MGVYIPYTRLPSAYQEVEYISSSGSQRIDVGIKPSDGTYGFEVKFRPNSTSGDWNIMNMGGTTTDNYRYGFGWYSSTDCQIGRQQSSGDYYAVQIPVNTSTDYTAQYNYNNSKDFVFDGVTKYSSLPLGSYSYSTNWNIFCQSYGSSNYVRYGSFRLYYMKITHGATLLRDFVPCYRKSDNVIGMYDLVNNQFYTNSGTGTFSKGNDVTMSELKNAYIGDAEPSWTLFTESNFASSSYGDKLFRKSDSWSAASFGTRDTYPVLYINSGSHYVTTIVLNSSNHTTLNSHKYIKEVVDYIAFEPTGNTHGGGVGISQIERIRYAYGQRYDGTYSDIRDTFIPTSGQGYKIEQIIDTSNMSCTTKFIKLSDNTETTLNYTKQYESSTDGYAYGHLARDQSCNSWLGNIHLYYAD